MKPANKINAIVSVWSNSPHQPTGYGQQAGMLVDRLKRDGAEVAAISNYGLEGNNSVYESPYGPVPHYARGFDPYSNDVLPVHHKHFVAKHKGKTLKDFIVTLYDVWVLRNPVLDEIKIASWVPMDHTTIPPKVAAWLKKDNVTPIAMAPNGVRLMQEAGIECEYVPHAIDTSVYKPTDKVGGQDVREFMGLTEDQFLVGMVGANKANGSIHRKAYGENFLAFSLFVKRHPNAILYVHADPAATLGGFNLLDLAMACGIPKDNLIFPNMIDLRYGFEQVDMAGFYSAMDVLLATSYGEGFGIPTMEAQACGTRVIGSNWAATPDLVSDDSWVVDGQPFWDEAQKSWFMIPSVPAILNALEAAYEAPRGVSEASVEFASMFDVEFVWETYWLSVLEKLSK
jgi:glycosyltransferase involved in cell wall biosynthesis